MKHVFSALTLLLAVACLGCSDSKKDTPTKTATQPETDSVNQPNPDDAANAKAIEKLTRGSHTKLVWLSHQNPSKSDTFVNGNSHILKGFDTRDGQGTRTLAGEMGNYGRPLITPDGSAVVFSHKNIERKDSIKHYRPEIHRINWDGTGQTTLGKGFAVDVWRDPATRKTWVYAVRDFVASERAAMRGSRLVRFPMDDPSKEEVVWDQTPISPDNIQLSRDGKRASGLFPWPDGGFFNFPEKEWTKTSHGCWAAMAPDNSYISWVFSGSHRTLFIFDGEGKKRRDLDLGGLDVIGKFEAYHPRWTNHPEFIVITGPYKQAKEGENVISKGGIDAEVFLVQVDENLTGFKGSVQLTENGSGDFYPDAWVSVGDDYNLFLTEDDTTETVGQDLVQWPATTDGLVFAWDDASKENKVEVSDDEIRICRFEPHGMGRFGRFYEMLAHRGHFEADPVSNQAISEAISESSAFTLEVMFTEHLTGKYEELSAKILSYATDDDNYAFALFRAYGNLKIQTQLKSADGSRSLEHPEDLGPFRVEKDRPLHLVATFEKGKLTCYVDGRFVTEVVLDLDSATGWTPGRFIAGDPEPFGTGWGAKIQCVSVYSRALTSAEVAKNYEGVRARSGNQLSIPKTRLQVKLIEATPLPTAESIEPYRRALVDYTYEVEKVLTGNYEQKKIVVLHWAILDGKPVPDLPRKVGQKFEILVEKATEHPELSSERKESGTSEVELPIYYDVETPGKDDEESQ